MSTLTTTAGRGLGVCAHPCWVLVDPDGTHLDIPEGEAHFPDPVAATARIEKMKAKAVKAGDARAEQTVDSLRLKELEGVCYVGPECIECETTYDQWCDAAVHLQGPDPVRDVLDTDWRLRVSDGAWVCGACAETTATRSYDDTLADRLLSTKEHFRAQDPKVLKAMDQQEIIDLLLKCAAGRREYIHPGHPQEIAQALTLEAQAYENAAALAAGDPWTLYSMLPSRSWTPEMHAALDASVGAPEALTEEDFEDYRHLDIYVRLACDREGRYYAYGHLDQAEMSAAAQRLDVYCGVGSPHDEWHPGTIEHRWAVLVERHCDHVTAGNWHVRWVEEGTPGAVPISVLG